MALTHNLGFPRIGHRRELKFALEDYWKQRTSADDLQTTAATLRSRHWKTQEDLDFTPVGDFSLYDHVLDMSVTLGHLPDRVKDRNGSELDQYFRAARGRSPADCGCAGVAAGEMTKWFDTNYHYIVPEIGTDTDFSLNSQRLVDQVAEARSAGVTPKPVIIGPVTYLWLCKARDGDDRLQKLEALLPVYGQLLDRLAELGVEWVQVDEPVLVTELDADWKAALETAYHTLKGSQVKLLLTTYFGTLGDNLQQACNLPVAGLHVDAVRGRQEVNAVVDWLPSHKVLSLGVINGRNIWKTNLTATLEWLSPLHDRLGNRLWLAPSCSLLHVPVDLESEDELDPEIRSWLAFACQKLEELRLLKDALNHGSNAVAGALSDNARAIASRQASSRVHNPDVRAQAQAIEPVHGTRQSPYPVRAEQQDRILQLPRYPTTTIGSFPQTGDIRKTRQAYRKGELSREAYEATMKAEIRHAVKAQETLGLDVLVHGEAERNDMVEYFGEQLEGYAFTRFGWVQSYGSRCVKPPILFGDIRRPAPMTVEWINYARSLTDRPLKGMLTGPVTILNWSFVRDDQPRKDTAFQLALAIRQEVLDLEAAGVNIIQIDEAALREGLPLRRSQWQDYLDWAIDAFRITANGVKDTTQIHTHMCYSEFNDIIDAIGAMDADVISIETARSKMELLDAFATCRYPAQIGPGVYDIHSPRVPSTDEMRALLVKARGAFDPGQLWVNPDCGLKTRRWEDVEPALANMVAAARLVRAETG